jgi:outer membrane receptor for ferrienterochelin and colicin
LLVLVIPGPVKAQQLPKFKINGVIIDSADKKPLAYTTVSLYKKGQPAQPLKTIYSDVRGKFQFSNIDTGNFTIIFTHAGLSGKKLDISVNQNLDLGEQVLSKSATVLKEITVYAQKPIIEQLDDKVIFNVENDPDSKTSSTLDIMRKTPLLSVDGDDNVQLNGQTNFKILVNGRETSMFARNVKEALKAFPGTLISKIEVTTSPPAKYDAEGVGGLINIITKKKVSGYNGSISTFNRTGAKANNINTNLNVKTGKIGFSANYFMDFFNNLETSNKLVTIPRVPSYFTKRQVNETWENDNFYNNGNGEISWEIDSLQTFSTYGNINGGNGNNEMLRNMTTDFSSSPSILSKQDLVSEYSWNGNSAGADYIKKFRNNKEREFSVRFFGEFSKNLNDDDSRQDNPGTDRFVINHSKTGNDQYTLQSDYIHPLPKNRKLESGVKAIFRKAYSDFQSLVTYDLSQSYQPDPENTDYFKYTQDVYSFYSTYNIRTKKTTFRLGFRVEHTSVFGDFVSSKTAVKQSYTNFIPNLQSTTKINPLFTLVFSYTERLQRPFIWNLNPFVFNSDTADISYGNPYLKPQIQHSLSGQLRFQKGASFASLGLYANLSNNMILMYSMFEPATGITKRTSDNVGKGQWFNANISMNTKLKQKWDLFMNANIQYIQGENTKLTNPKVRSMGAFTNFGGTYRFSKTVSASSFFSVNRPPGQLQTSYSTNIWYNALVNIKFFKEKFNISLRGVNVFHKTWDYKFITTDPNFQTIRTNTRPLRGFVFTTTYNFGKLKENVSKKRGVTNDDLLNNSQ